MFRKAKQFDSTCLNYVWINKEPIITHEDGELCGIPLNRIDRAHQNAKAYPETAFNIWVDYKLLDCSTRFFIESHDHINSPDNVQLRDLNDIPTYAENAHFSPEGGTDIWARVDYARLLVLEHCLKTTDVDVAFYSDFDTRDVSIENKEALKSLHKYGVVLGSVIKDDGGKGMVENGYFGLCKETGEHFLDSYLLPETEKALMDNRDGFEALKASIDGWRNERGNGKRPRSRIELAIPVLFRMGYRMPPDYQRFDDFRINDLEESVIDKPDYNFAAAMRDI